jgi:protein-L-isoaspartate(D-aspartate) O-methyltransferase
MERRARMVAEQIRARGVADERVLDALTRVPRDRFIPEELRYEAHGDYPVPIGHGQTISQPYIVAYMTEALQVHRTHRVLEIGTGCGYQTAVLAELAAEVFSIERIPELAARARETLDGMGYTNVQIRAGDGYEGWPEHAPYDRILGAAAADTVPPALVEQLVDGGILVIPVGTFHQELRVIQKRGTRTEVLATLPVRFVPMIKGK